MFYFLYISPATIALLMDVGTVQKRRNGGRRRIRNELNGAPSTRAGGLKKNLLKSYRKLVPEARELPTHLKELVEGMLNDHRQMALINYEGALLVNFIYASFIEKGLFLPSLDMQTYLSVFNAVSEKDTEKGRPTSPPFFEAPLHPLLKYLREAVSELVDESSGELIERPSDNSPVVSYDPSYILQPWSDPDGYNANESAWVRLQYLVAYVLNLGPDHIFIGNGFTWHIKHLYLVINAFNITRGAYKSLLKHLNSGYLWEHKLRPPHLLEI